MEHFKFLWLQIKEWFLHFFFVDHQEMEHRIASDISNQVTTKVSEQIQLDIEKAVREQTEPLIRQHRETQRLLQATADALRGKGETIIDFPNFGRRDESGGNSVSD